MCEKSGIFSLNSVPIYRTITKKAYRTCTISKKAIPHQRTVLLSKNWSVPYHTVILDCDSQCNNCNVGKKKQWLWSEVEFLRTSMSLRTSSRTQFEVLGLGLEGQILGLENALSSARGQHYFLTCWKYEKVMSTNFVENLRICGRRPFFWDCLQFMENLRKFWAKIFFLFLENTSALCSLSLASTILSLVSRGSALRWCVLGLGLSLVFFCVLGLGLKPCVLDSTSGCDIDE